MENGARVYNVLLVEDDVIDRESFCRVLGKSDQVAVVTAGCLNDGIQLIRRTPFDVVLFDLGLPDSYGIDTIKRMTEEFPSTPLIVLTGLADVQTAEQAIEYGIRDYLVKGEVADEDLLSSVLKAALPEAA